MAVLDADRVVRACKKVGFRYGGGLDYIVAIGKAESGLDEQVISPVNSDGTVDIGWPQINSGHLPNGKYRTLATNPEAVAYADDTLGHEWTQEDLRVCEHAAMAAWLLSSHGSNFGPWTTFKSGAFKLHMALAQTARRLVDAQDRGDAFALALDETRARIAKAKEALG